MSSYRFIMDMIDSISSIFHSSQGRVLLKVVNPNVDVNVDVTFVNFAFY